MKALKFLSTNFCKIFALLALMPAAAHAQFHAKYLSESSNQNQSLAGSFIQIGFLAPDLGYPVSGDSRQNSLNVAVQESKGSYPNHNFKARRLNASYGQFIIPNHYLSLTAGVAEVKKETSSQSTTEISLNSQHLVASHLVALSVFRKSAFDSWMFPGAIDSNLKTTGLKLTETYTASTKWILRTSGDYQEFSDDNKRSYFDLGAFYKFENFEWLLLGAGFNVLSFSNQLSSYWSPSAALSYGPRIEVAHSLAANVQLVGGINGGIYKESGFSQAATYYAQGGVLIGDRERNNLRLDFVQNKTKQSSSTWQFNSFMISGHWFF